MKFGFDCKVRKLSAKTVANYQKQLRYIERYLKDEFQITEVEESKPCCIKQFFAMIDDIHESKTEQIAELEMYYGFLFIRDKLS